jgi:hypothetical protein
MMAAFFDLDDDMLVVERFSADAALRRLNAVLEERLQRVWH